MPTNPNNPFGFRYVGLTSGAPGNSGIFTAKISRNNTNKIFTGDVLTPISGGFFDVASVVGGGEPIGGIAVGFAWDSFSRGLRTYQGWWPGTPGDAMLDVTVRIARHPDAYFEVQSLHGPVTPDKLGLNANFAVGAGGQQTPGGISSFSLDDSTLSTAPSLPFRLYEMEEASNPILLRQGYDPSFPYNRVRVTFNNLVRP